MKRNLFIVLVVFIITLGAMVSTGSGNFNWPMVWISLGVSLAAFLLLSARDFFMTRMNRSSPISGMIKFAFITLSTAGLIGMGVLTLMDKIPLYSWLLFTILFFPEEKKGK